MTAPLVTSLAAYMIITGRLIPMPVTMIWMISLSLLGVLFAFPLKRRFINDEQYPFPEGRACGGRDPTAVVGRRWSPPAARPTLDGLGFPAPNRP